jgi:hypothetical protein
MVNVVGDHIPRRREVPPHGIQVELAHWHHPLRDKTEDGVGRMLIAGRRSVDGTSVTTGRSDGLNAAFSIFGLRPAHVAQVAEHLLGKEKVPGSNPGVGSTTSPPSARLASPA